MEIWIRMVGHVYVGKSLAKREKRRGSFMATRAWEKQRTRTVATAEYSSDAAGVEHDSEASALWRVEASKAATPLI
jgi:hypothetical protein